MNIIKNGSIPSQQGASDYFTGTVRVDNLLLPQSDESRLVTATVTFEPKARTTWHTHPVGQLLMVTAGVGYVQTWGGERQQIQAGDRVWFPANEKHWHGASESTAMTHIALQEAVDGNTVTWLEQVNDEQYMG